MTVPVLTATYANGLRTQMFYVPAHLADSVPNPTDPQVFLIEYPEKEFYIRQVCEGLCIVKLVKVGSSVFSR
jgi:hypothetical protein